MAAFDSSRVHHASSGRFGQVFVSAFGSLVSWYQARQTRIALSRLTDRELEDIGLLRRDIHSIT